MLLNFPGKVSEKSEKCSNIQNANHSTLTSEVSGGKSNGNGKDNYNIY